MWPQIIFIVIMTLGLGIQIANHGQPDTYNGETSFVGQIIIYAILYWGGFFDCFFN